MMLLHLVTAALCLGVSVSVSAPGPEKAFEIPPWNFTMFCTLQKQGAIEKHRSWQPREHRNSSSLHSSLSEHMRNANISCSKDQDGFGCCLGKEHWPVQLINEENSIRMDIRCWAHEDLTLFICTLNPQDWKMHTFAKYRMKHRDLLYFDQKESNVSTCVSNCLQQHVIKCTISALDLNRKYLIWIELITGSGSLQSPMMLVTPINVASRPLHIPRIYRREVWWNQYFQYTAVGHLIILFLGSQRLSSKGRKERIFWRVVFFFFYTYSYATV